MKKIVIFIVLNFCFVFSEFVFASEDWDNILQETSNQIPKLEITDTSDRIQLIVHAIKFGKKELIVFIDQYLQNRYDPILMDMYLSHSLKNGLQDEKVFKRLNLFNKKEANNSLSYFYLSYYHAIKSDFELSKFYLAEANKHTEFNSYNKAQKKIVYEYILSKTKNEIYAYVSAIIVDIDLNMILRRMSNKLIPDTFSDLRKVMFQFGEKIEANSETLILKMISVGIQIDCTDKQVDPELYSFLLKRHSSYKDLWLSLEGKTGKQSLLNYLKSVYSNGEVSAIRMLK